MGSSSKQLNLLELLNKKSQGQNTRELFDHIPFTFGENIRESKRNMIEKFTCVLALGFVFLGPRIISWFQTYF